MNITDNYCAKTGVKLNRAWREGEHIILDDERGLVAYHSRHSPYTYNFTSRDDLNGMYVPTPLDYDEAVKEIDSWSKLPEIHFHCCEGLRNENVLTFPQGTTSSNNRTYRHSDDYFKDAKVLSDRKDMLEMSHKPLRKLISASEAKSLRDSWKLPAVAFRGNVCGLLLFAEGETEGVWFYEWGKVSHSSSLSRQNTIHLTSIDFATAQHEAMGFILTASPSEGRS